MTHKASELKSCPPWHSKPANPDWSNEEDVARWIEHTRSNAFFAGARGDEISRAEAEALVLALKSRAPCNENDVERVRVALDDLRVAADVCEIDENPIVVKQAARIRAARAAVAALNKERQS